MIEHLFNMHKALALIPSSGNVCVPACGDVTNLRTLRFQGGGLSKV